MFNRLTCSLTALQFIEARGLLGCPKEQLPLLAAILYYPDRYSSAGAHKLAQKFTGMPMDELISIAFNFQAFTNYLFTKTEFKLLTELEETKVSAISTGALVSLFFLSSVGFGDIETIDQLNVILYLTFLRKNIFVTVRSLHAAKMDKADIAREVRLPIHIINEIL